MFYFLYYLFRHNQSSTLTFLFSLLYNAGGEPEYISKNLNQKKSPRSLLQRKHFKLKALFDAPRATLEKEEL